MRSSLVVPSPRRAPSRSCGARPLFPIPEKAPPTAAPAKAPNDITTRRAPQEALAASKRPSTVPTTTNPMKMSFLISTSWIESTSDDKSFKSQTRAIVHHHYQDPEIRGALVIRSNTNIHCAANITFHLAIHVPPAAPPNFSSRSFPQHSLPRF